MRIMPFIISLWLSSDSARRCLDSLSSIEGVKPEFYIFENNSKNSSEIKKNVVSNQNVKGYIQFKENFVTGSGLLAFEYFQKKIKEEYVVITDGNLLVYSDSIANQLKILTQEENAGIICQRPNNLGLDSYTLNMMENWYKSGVTDNSHENFDRAISNSCHMMMAKKEDFRKITKAILYKEILFETIEPFTFIPSYRFPIWMDTDICRYFEIVLSKKSLTYKKHLCYDLAIEENNRSDSEYLKEKRKVNYKELWKEYANNQPFTESCHNPRYDNGELKYNVII